MRRQNIPAVEWAQIAGSHTGVSMNAGLVLRTSANVGNANFELNDILGQFEGVTSDEVNPDGTGTQDQEN